jgi:two-component system, NtrC family, sensor kinase
MLVSATRHYAADGWHRNPGPAVNKAAIRTAELVGAMAFVVALVAGVSYWDVERESDAALAALGEQQATVARALAAAYDARGDDGHRGPDSAELMGALRELEIPNALAVLLHDADEAVRTTGGRPVDAPTLRAALATRAPWVRIPRDEAPVFGLPRRTAFAGIASVSAGARDRPLDVIVVASAKRERDREAWARRRLVLSVLIAAGLVGVFGGLAMRKQRNELLLENELSLAALRAWRDERLVRASRAAAMGTLAMGVAHEVSTPLGIIAARAEQMQPRVRGDERLSTAVDAILSQIDRIKQVIQGLLGLARGDAPSADRIDPRALVDHAVALVEHRFGKAGVRVIAEVSADLPAVLGDPRLLEHAVVNLLLNACDASQPGAEVRVSAEADGDRIRIAVLDEGTGISASDLNRAQEPFFTTKPRGEGSGLGLAIAREIVASHRGKLEFAARHPRGTAVTIKLPAVNDG